MAVKLDLAQISSKAELSRFFDDVQFLKSASEARLATLSAAHTPAACTSEVNALVAKLSAPAEQSAQLSSVLSSASQCADESKAKIDRSLLLYARAKEARELVENVTTLRQAIQGMHGAMEMRDWERAAQLAQEALRVPNDVFESQFAIRAVPSIELPEPPRETLDKACSELGALFAREFDRAAGARDMVRLTSYFKLFPLIGRCELGLQRYASFLCQIIAGMSRDLLLSGQQHAPGFYAVAFSKLMENIAAIVSQHSAIVSKHYGAEAMPETVVPLIQVEVDKQAGLIIDTFWDERRIEQLLADCRAYSYPQLMRSFASTSVEPEPGDSVAELVSASERLSEISTMMNRWHLYTQFLIKQYRAQEEPLAETLAASMTQSKLAALLRPTFAALALFIFRRSLERAVVADELPDEAAIGAHAVFAEDAPLVSSLVDDVLYVFSNVLGQAADCEDRETAEDAFAALKRVLESDLIGTLQRKLRQSAPTELEQSYTPFAIYLNDLEVTSQYVAKAIDSILAEKHEVSGLHERLVQFKSSLHVRTNELMLDGCQTLVTTRLGAQLRATVQKVFVRATYQGESDYSRNGYAYELQLKRQLKPLRQLLHPAVLNEVLLLLNRQVAQQLERFVWSLEGKMNARHALMLERDLNHVVQVSTESAYAQRKCFERLLEMVSVTIEGENTPTSKLSAEEVQRLLRFIAKDV